MANDTHFPHRPLPPLAVAPHEAARLAGVGRTTVYAALARGDLASIKIGTRRLILVEAIRDWLDRNQTSPGA